MPFIDELNKLRTNVANAYVALEEKGATMPTNRNMDNLAATIETVTGGGGSVGELPIPLGLHVDDRGVATWNPVEGAAQYRYQINNLTPQYTTGTKVTIQNGQSVKVHAVFHSDFSGSITYSVLATPNPVVDAHGLVTWESVPNASHYVCNFNDEEVITSETSFQFQSEGVFRVRAISSIEGTYDSQWSKYVEYIMADSSGYLQFVSDTPITITPASEIRGESWDNILEFSTNAIAWNVWEKYTPIYSESGILYVRGVNNRYISNEFSHCDWKVWDIDGTNVRINGELATLIDYQSFLDNGYVTLVGSIGIGIASINHFGSLFAKNSSIVKAPSLNGFRGYSDGLFNHLFEGCTSLVDVPISIDVSQCSHSRSTFWNMFSGCTSLVRPPRIINTGNQLLEGMFYQMYEGCTSLRYASVILSTPGHRVDRSCFNSMYYGCTNLEQLTDISKYLNDKSRSTACMYYNCSKIKMSLSKTEEYKNEYRLYTSFKDYTADMFEGTGGTFTGTPTSPILFTSNEIV